MVASPCSGEGVKGSGSLPLGIYKWKDAGSEQTVSVAPTEASLVGEEARSRTAPG